MKTEDQEAIRSKLKRNGNQWRESETGRTPANKHPSTVDVPLWLQLEFRNASTDSYDCSDINLAEETFI